MMKRIFIGIEEKFIEKRLKSGEYLLLLIYKHVKGKTNSKG